MKLKSVFGMASLELVEALGGSEMCNSVMSMSTMVLHRSSDPLIRFCKIYNFFPWEFQV